MTGVSLSELPLTTLLRTDDVARYLGCSNRSVQRAGIPCVEIRPRVRRYMVRDVLAWLEERRRV